MWNSAGGAEKGESITDVSNLLRGGRGHLAFGGGGGNKLITGSGGGGNFTAGGKGGNEMQGCSQDGNGGIGGLALQYSSASNKLFMGGGGGCGDINNLVGSPGKNGGGIIVLKAQTIVGNNHSIYNNNLDQTIQATTIGDVAGRGGAGGSVIFNNTNFVGNLFIQVNGGDGGDQGASTTYGCFGPGGGGGAGLVVSDITLPANLSIQNLPGSHGQILNTTMPCLAMARHMVRPTVLQNP